ncbi:extracellular serine-rich protein [Apiospora aurea]|uniref:Extracellular serine-rich protein n=1 Tax=Apiospora aurea TaxID=335848 RepID=A0ABR1PW68_9PEZI
MRLFLGAFAFAVGASMSSAHDTNPLQTGSLATQPAVTPVIHTISVGAGFPSGQTQPRRMWEISFVARAEFRYPCLPYETVETGRRGFYSDLVPVQAIPNEPPHFDVRINDTESVFFYCTAPGSCLENSMVGVINPNGTFTLDIQKQYVLNSTFEFAPGQPLPTEMPRSDPRVPGGYMPFAANTTGSQYGGGGGQDLMSGAVIAGIAVGGAALLGLVAGLLFMGCRKRLLCMVRQQRGHIAPRSAPSPSPVPPARPPRSPHRGSEGLLFACQGERTPSSRSVTPRGGAAASGSAGRDVRRMNPTAQEQGDEVVVAYSSPEAPYYGIISPMREKPVHYHRQQQPSHGTATYSMSSSQYHPRAPIMLAASTTPQTPPPVELPASADPGNSPLPRYYNNNWGVPFYGTQ